jgi:adenylate cyclase
VKIKIRRLKTLGIALGLSAIAAALGVVGYTLPRATLTTVNRIEDYVLLNEGRFWLIDQPALAFLHVPDYDEEDQNIRLLKIDEQAVLPEPTGYGTWPWPRSTHAAILERLAKAGAKMVTFDVLFPDPATDPAQDRAFAAGMHAQPTILGYELATTQGGSLYAQPPPPMLRSAARAIGFTSVDNPGGWLVGQYFTITAGPTVYHSLSAQTVEQFTGEKISPIDAWHARLGNDIIPLDGDGLFTMLPFRVIGTVDIGGSAASRVGAEDISAPMMQQGSLADFKAMDDTTLKAFVGGKIVVIGPTAQGLGDFIVTPNGRYPGVFANIRLMDQLLTHKFIRRVPPWLDLFAIIFLPLLIGFVVTQLKPVTGIVVAACVVVLYTLLSIGLYAYTLHWLNFLHVDAAVLLSALFVALYRIVTEGADKRVIREMFGKHVSPALVTQMLENDDPKAALNLQGKRVRVTIFYSDIRGFTAMSEKMTPEQIYGQLNEYFEEMCALVFKYGGYVDKFIGDCLMAVFSAPNPTPDDAYKACISALEQQEKILEMAAAWAGEGKKIFTVGMGLNTGEVVMGNLGSSERLNYTVIGDNVNTAARLYNVAKGGQIIISESTYEEVKDRFIVNELQPVSVKGKTLPLRNFEIVARLEPGQENTSKILDQSIVHEAFVAADH